MDRIGKKFVYMLLLIKALKMGQYNRSFTCKEFFDYLTPSTVKRETISHLKLLIKSMKSGEMMISKEL